MQYVKIFCSGIGGIGLSAYAAYQNASGHTVLGSDQTENAITKDLMSQGIDVSSNQNGDALPEDADLFVHTLALPKDHPERKKATALGIRQRTYFQALGDLTKESTLIAVAGTHGKSSTTAMAAKVLIDAGLDPSVILGTKTPDLDGRNWRKGMSSIFLVEACEYCRSFLNLQPKVVLLTNVTGDHFDAFTDEEDYRKAFEEFLVRIPSDGKLIMHADDPAHEWIDEVVPALVQVNVQPIVQKELPPLTVPGDHMRKNAMLVMTLADLLEVKNAAESLRNYKGCWRRSEVKGRTKEGVLVIDDYGHHPNEVKVTLKGFKEAHPDRRLICVFQPHTHDRTSKFYDEFTKAFSSADRVIIPNIFAARSDRDSEQVDPRKLAEDIATESHVETKYGESLDQTVALLTEDALTEKDLLVTMGAGDVWKVADRLTS